jgi:hypothetical protein
MEALVVIFALIAGIALGAFADRVRDERRIARARRSIHRVPLRSRTLGIRIARPRTLAPRDFPLIAAPRSLCREPVLS